ncbi:MAG: hypothetical protein KAJ86_03020 [Alphaproteobacteria bacterium]|nr:hypothetical protein [Alphaproteobacteria bacterium]
MQNNDEPKDDIFDDEFDDDDLADDSWDEFDDDDLANNDDDGTQISKPENAVFEDIKESTKKEPTEKSKNRKKSFSKKKFNLVIILIAIIAAGLIFLNQMTSSNKQEKTSQFDIADETQTLTNVAALSTDTTIPPMPTPINTTQENHTEIAKAPLLQDLLTPMPSDNSSENTILSELNIKEVPTVPVSNEALKIADEQPLKFNKEIKKEKIQKITSVLSAPNDAKLLKEMIIRSNEFTNKIKILEEKYTNENKALSINLTKANNKIETLLSSIAVLEKKLKTLSIKTTKITPINDPVISTPIAAPKPTIPKPVLKKPQQSQIVTEKIMPTTKVWELRSAQPGKALIAPTGSNDMKTVYVGDIIDDIGKITSITVENGKWIIRGTQNNISQ